jgi:hypothetical protein
LGKEGGIDMTELQLDAVRDEVSIFLGNIIPDYHDRHEVVGLILDDVVADIDETADWSDYEDDEYNLGDIQIALARVLLETVRSRYDK